MFPGGCQGFGWQSTVCSMYNYIYESVIAGGSTEENTAKLLSKCIRQ